MKRVFKYIVGLVTICMVMSTVGCSNKTKDDTGIKWDTEVDFLIVGYGLAGEAAALEANDIDPNASILVLEKMNRDQAGGNSIASGQTFIIPAKDDIATFKTYMESCNEPNPIPDEYLDWMVNEFADQVKWIAGTMEKADYEVGYVGGGPARWGSLVVEFADIPGGDFKGTSAHIRKIGTPSFEPGGIWNGFNAAVELRENIEVAYGTMATELIQDPVTKRIEGVVASDWEGNKTNIKANKGVLLACGGFENNLEMQQNFHGMDRVYTSGTPGNTGDGIEMLMRAGAKMWHMKNQTQSGGFWLGVKVPEYDSTFIRNMTFKKGSWIEVDAQSNRFYNESKTYHRQHMKDKEYGKYLDLGHDRALPVHMIFDEKVRTSDTIVSLWLSWPMTTLQYPWSADNSAEIEKGWIIKGDTIEELAQKMNRDPVELKATIDEYNASVDAGVDALYNRDIATMEKIDTGPYYAVEITPTLVATTGGAERNTNSQVLDWDNNIIPNLYEAGELGSYVSNLYQNGVFLSEAIASGRAAAQHAFGGESTVTSDFEVLDAADVNKDSVFAKTKDGVYEVEVEGNFTIQAKVSVGKITLLQVSEGAEKMYMDAQQQRELFDKIVAEQSLSVDAISGATSESQAILDALNSTFK